MTGPDETSDQTMIVMVVLPSKEICLSAAIVEASRRRGRKATKLPERRSIVFAQLVLLHLAHGVAGQGVGEEHLLGNLEIRDLAFAGLDHGVGGQVIVAGFADNDRTHRLAEVGMR